VDKHLQVIYRITANYRIESKVILIANKKSLKNLKNWKNSPRFNNNEEMMEGIKT
jgi:hypothetical protein